jgi:hypothetical protein
MKETGRNSWLMAVGPLLWTAHRSCPRRAGPIRHLPIGHSASRRRPRPIFFLAPCFGRPSPFAWTPHGHLPNVTPSRTGEAASTAVAHRRGHSESSTAKKSQITRGGDGEVGSAPPYHLVETRVVLPALVRERGSSEVPHPTPRDCGVQVHAGRAGWRATGHRVQERCIMNPIHHPKGTSFDHDDSHQREPAYLIPRTRMSSARTEGRIGQPWRSHVLHHA